VDWNAIKAEYIAGGTSYRKLAEKYGVSKTTLERKAKAEKWIELRGQAEDRVETNIVNQVTKTKTKNAIKLESVADKALEKILELLEVANDTQSIKHITSALRDIKEVKGIKSKADMKEQNARIAKLQAEVNRDDNTVKEIEVTFNAGKEDWNE
jgi:transposase-like protein